MLALFPILRLMHFSYPGPTSASALAQVSRVIEEIHLQIAKVAPNAEFAVTLYPYIAHVIGPKLTPYLERAGIKVIDLTEYDFEQATEQRMMIPEDGHPSKYTNFLLARIYAQRIAREKKLEESGTPIKCIN